MGFVSENPEHILDIYHDVAHGGRILAVDGGETRFLSVEVEANEFSLGIDDGATRVAGDGFGIGQQTAMNRDALLAAEVFDLARSETHSFVCIVFLNLIMEHVAIGTHIGAVEFGLATGVRCLVLADACYPVAIEGEAEVVECVALQGFGALFDGVVEEGADFGGIGE